ncbi:coiled-coil domain-containing protein 158-like [Myxocyprinus asiaticus]|uniref:coiled-coil domain-containing protein 158-like n=1 Tax=Myxocyprinus asiaticus TaxID=70543 RepID=UPI002223293C|nr:coiled-coil domain-containing protein 158-like [Myxocyprinus asiaticus]
MSALESQKQQTYETKEESAGERRQLQALLEQRELELQQVHVQLEEAQGLLKAMRAETDDWKMNSELKNVTQITCEHSCSVDIQNENCLTNQIDHLRVENRQLRAALRQSELRLSTVQSEKACQQAALSDKICSVHQLTVEKQHMTAELGVCCMQLSQLKEEQDALKELLSSRTGKLEQQNLQLKTQLKTVQTELTQARSFLRIQERAERHGTYSLKVALGMQKQITAKRKHIDFLEGQIQLLEETIEKLKLEKHQQALEVKRQTQELMLERTGRRRLKTEMEALRSQERELKSKAERLEAALYKMSDSFAECQNFIQKQEQELMRLKLQHALDMKELQSQNLRNVSRSPVSSCTPQTHLVLTQHNVNGQMELGVSDPIVELRSFIRELRGGIDEEHGPHISTGFGTRSEENHKSRVIKKTEDAEGTTRPTGKITSHKQPSFGTAEPDKQNCKSAFSAHNNALGFGTGRSAHATGCRSPVHALLTSDLPAERNYRLKTEHLANIKQISANNQEELTGGQTSKKIQHKRDRC